MIPNLDSLDVKLIEQLQTDGRVSITDLTERVGSSRPTVTSRLRRLLGEEIVLVRGGLNLRKCGFKMACVGLEVKSDLNRLQVEEYLKSCPRVLSVSRTTGKANLHIALWGEDDQTINSTIESFRDFPNVDIVYTHYLGTPIEGDFMIQVKIAEDDETPCARKCVDCYRYANEWCLGCPGTVDYKNPIVK